MGSPVDSKETRLILKWRLKMMGKVTELVVTKGKTIKAGDKDEWIRVEYSVKAAIDGDQELAVAKAQIEGLVDGWLTGIARPASTMAPAKSPTPAAAPTESAATLFPKELADLLAFTEKDCCIVVKPREFLGSDNFARIAKIIKDAGGRYVSEGKQSHFELPRHK